jgi:hypothetical protein
MTSETIRRRGSAVRSNRLNSGMELLIRPSLRLIIILGIDCDKIKNFAKRMNQPAESSNQRDQI